MLTPQQLIDLPGAGAAEKQLRKEGRWRLTKEERFQRAADKLFNAVDDAHDAAYYLEKEIT